MKVLALASNYEPLGVIGWEKAITLVLSRKVTVLEESEKVVRSPTTSFKIPSVVVFNTKFKKGSKSVRFSRKNIWLRDEGRCQYCNQAVAFSALTIDHVQPKCFGGLSTWDNVVSCCYNCNQKKGDKNLKQVNMALRKKPCKPTSLPITSHVDDYFNSNALVPESWKFWIGAN